MKNNKPKSSISDKFVWKVSDIVIVEPSQATKSMRSFILTMLKHLQGQHDHSGANNAT